jgi:hypothetical protein
MTSKTVVAASLGLGALALAGGVSILPWPARAAPADTKVLTFYVLPDEQGLLGPDKKHHDTFVPSNMVVRQGVPVTLRFISYDDALHTMIAPELGVNVVIAPATHTESEDGGTSRPYRVTSYTFTPERAGQFRWHCNILCDPWAMNAGYDGPGRDSFMAGYIVVLK